MRSGHRKRPRDWDTRRRAPSGKHDDERQIVEIGLHGDDKKRDLPERYAGGQQKPETVMGGHLPAVLVGPGATEHQHADGIRPPLELVAVGRRHAEHLGDHHRGDRIGHLPDEVDLPRLGQVEDRVDDLAKVMPVDGGDGLATVKLSSKDSKVAAKMAERTMSDPSSDPTTGADLGAGPSTLMAPIRL